MSKGWKSRLRSDTLVSMATSRHTVIVSDFGLGMVREVYWHLSNQNKSVNEAFNLHVSDAGQQVVCKS